MAGCKPNCCTQPRAAPWGNDVALIKVSRSVRATCFMRGNAPCGVKGVMGYALSARGIFAQAQKCRMYQSRSTFSQGAALGYGQHLGLQPAPIIYRAFVQIGSYKCTFGRAMEKAEICFLARALRIYFPVKPFNPALIRINVCIQTGCECMVCTSNPSLMTGLSCPDIGTYTRTFLDLLGCARHSPFRAPLSAR